MQFQSLKLVSEQSSWPCLFQGSKTLKKSEMKWIKRYVGFFNSHVEKSKIRICPNSAQRLPENEEYFYRHC